MPGGSRSSYSPSGCSKSMNSSSSSEFPYELKYSESIDPSCGGTAAAAAPIDFCVLSMVLNVMNRKRNTRSAISNFNELDIFASTINTRLKRRKMNSMNISRGARKVEICVTFTLYTASIRKLGTRARVPTFQLDAVQSALSHWATMRLGHWATERLSDWARLSHCSCEPLHTCTSQSVCV